MLLLPACVPAGAETVILQIQIMEGEGAVFPAASKSLRPVTVRVTDETGAPLSGVAVSFRLPEEGVTGTFQNGLKTDLAMTSAEGKAISPNIQWGPMAGPVRLRVTAAKDDARAGAFVPLYLSSSAATPENMVVAGAAIAPQVAPVRVDGVAGTPKLKSRKGWVRVVAIAAAAGAGGGLALTKAGRKAAPTQTAGLLPAVSIGQPSITVGN